jgi:hypothetical protein
VITVTNNRSIAASALSASSFVLAYRDDSNSSYGTVAICTVSGTSISCGPETIFNADTTAYITTTSLSSSTFVIAYQDINNSNYGTGVACTVSGTTISCGTKTVFYSGHSIYNAAAPLSSSQCAIAFSYSSLGLVTIGTVTIPRRRVITTIDY